MTILSRLLLTCFAWISYLTVPAMVLATSASIDVYGNEGAITVSAEAKFSTHTFCSGSGSNQKCWDDSTGSLTVYRNSSRLGSASGDGKASWTDVLNAGLMAQGEHTFEATARDSNGDTDTAKKTITVDNTPEVTVSADDKPDGDMNVQGTVKFKENIEGAEGSVMLFIYWNGSNSYPTYYGMKTIDVAGATDWSWDKIAGAPLNAGGLRQGTHKLLVQATAANGTIKKEYYEFTIDNTPEVTVDSNKPDGDMNVHGTVKFKENIEGAEGSVELYIYWNGSPTYYGMKTIDVAGATDWSWDKIADEPLNAGLLRQGTHKLMVRATAANGTIKEEYHEFTIDNTPEVTVDANKPDGDMNVHGTVKFKENIEGAEGSVELYIYWNGSPTYYGMKTIDVAGATDWSWDKIAGAPLNSGLLQQGTHKLMVRAKAANGTITEEYYEFTIDNTPEVTVDANKPDGDMNVHGTVKFKENIEGAEGSVELYIYWNGSPTYYGMKTIDVAGATDWSWDKIAGAPLNSGLLQQGTHKLMVRATAANGTITEEYYEFTIDNTPTPVILGSKCFPDETFDILGTTTFKGNTAGKEGTIALYIKDISASKYTKHGKTKSYEGKKISWKYSDFTGARMKKSVWGQREILVKIVTTAANGASASAVKGMVIPALGCPTTFGN